MRGGAGKYVNRLLSVLHFNAFLFSPFFSALFATETFFFLCSLVMNFLTRKMVLEPSVTSKECRERLLGVFSKFYELDVKDLRSSVIPHYIIALDDKEEWQKCVDSTAEQYLEERNGKIEGGRTGYDPVDVTKTTWRFWASLAIAIYGDHRWTYRLRFMCIFFGLVNFEKLPTFSPHSDIIRYVIHQQSWENLQCYLEDRCIGTNDHFGMDLVYFAANCLNIAISVTLPERRLDSIFWDNYLVERTHYPALRHGEDVLKTVNLFFTNERFKNDGLYKEEDETSLSINHCVPLIRRNKRVKDEPLPQVNEKKPVYHFSMLTVPQTTGEWCLDEEIKETVAGPGENNRKMDDMKVFRAPPGSQYIALDVCNEALTKAVGDWLKELDDAGNRDKAYIDLSQYLCDRETGKLNEAEIITDFVNATRRIQKTKREEKQKQSENVMETDPPLEDDPPPSHMSDSIDVDDSELGGKKKKKKNDKEDSEGKKRRPERSSKKRQGKEENSDEEEEEEEEMRPKHSYLNHNLTRKVAYLNALMDPDMEVHEELEWPIERGQLLKYRRPSYMKGEDTTVIR